MSFEERKRELKEEEGDASARGRRRALHRELLRGGMQRVRKASFVVVNPTHIAIAMAYRPPSVTVPEVIVAAADATALRVRSIARRENIPIVENVQLARALYRDARAGCAIPHALYVAVADVVAALMRQGALRRDCEEARGLRLSPASCWRSSAILIVPLPPWLLDLLLGINIFGSALVLLLAVTVEEPLEFSAFAPALLIATLFRLSLDVSATRLILSDGNVPGSGRAPSFRRSASSSCAATSSSALIVFAILDDDPVRRDRERLAARRRSRRALHARRDAGQADGDRCRRARRRARRRCRAAQARCGAARSRFLRRDGRRGKVRQRRCGCGARDRRAQPRSAVSWSASPITACRRSRRINTFALLSIGNALVTTLPAFLISTAMGLMVTRVASRRRAGRRSGDAALYAPRRVAQRRRAVARALVRPGAAAPALRAARQRCVRAGGVRAQASRARRERSAAKRASAPSATPCAVRRLALGLVGVDAVAIEIGADLAMLLAPPLCDALLDRIGEVRRALAADVGIVLPGVRLRDDLARDPRTYGVRVRDRLVGNGRLELERLLAVADETVLSRFAAQIEDEPVYGLPAAWIAPDVRESARQCRRARFRPDLSARLARRRSGARARRRAGRPPRAANALRTSALVGAGARQGTQRHAALCQGASRVDAAVTRRRMAARSDRGL